MAHILDVMNERVLLCDGTIGTSLPMDLDAEKDFWGHENCPNILVRSRPDLIREISRGFFAAGSDMVAAMTFGGTPGTLDEFGIGELAFDLNKEAVELIREVAEEFRGDGKERFISANLGPGTKLPSLGHVDYDTLENDYFIQCGGVLAGGVDVLLILTCQDPLQIKAAINGARRACRDSGTETPILVTVTVETTGTMLAGSDIAAAATMVQAYDIPMMGLNCATGPQEMAEHIHWLAENWSGLIGIQPNAGLPELVDGQASYPLTPDELAKWHERFIEEDGVNMVGGCCGANAGHIEAVDAMLRRIAPNGADRPTVKRRDVHWVPGVASLFGRVDYRQENAFFAIGERCNANGSKKFRELQAAEDWEACVAMGREQVKEGSHALDLCTAYVGRDEIADMTEMMTRLRGTVDAPIVVDSTDLAVLEAALKLYGGKGVINSINFEDGEEEAAGRLELARRFGAAVVALTIDEDGMAKDVEAKVRIARRLHDFACEHHGLHPADLLIDPLTFTVCTGNEDDRKLALWTLEAIEGIREALPEVQIILGVSNVSFGLKPAARHVLNSVFLDHALKRGMTGAIVHFSRILPLHKIPEEERQVAEDLIFDNRREGYDPLQEFIKLYADRRVEAAKKAERPESVEERLKLRIVDGDRVGLDEDLNEALGTHPPTEIINEILLDGMKVVGDLFASGEMQLPFVLQAAETMKAAVSHLEPHMEKADNKGKGTMVLATVKGDVHDIGKNLVDIILSNNGYQVVNLGTKQPIHDIIAAVGENGADAVGMSGLLVKSAAIMQDNLKEMARQGLDLPVMLGGAALTRKYVEEDCVAAYGAPRVAYAQDAFAGLKLMEKVAAGELDDYVAGTETASPADHLSAMPSAEDQKRKRPIDYAEVRVRRAELHADVEVPTPPFWGSRRLEEIPVTALVPFINERMLFQFQWGFKKDGRDIKEWEEWAAKEVRPTMLRLIDECAEADVLHPEAVYGYWRCASEGDSVVLFEEDGETELTRFDFPRQPWEGGICISDFIRDVAEEERDVIALQVVTVGQEASDATRAHFHDDKYEDYLYMHGFSVEMAEALAEYVHKRIRGELGFGHQDPRDMEKLLRQGYRGARFSFGYPACPHLEDQARILELLDAGRIGVTMSDEHQLHPELSTTAVVVHHPQAKYFSVRRRSRQRTGTDG